MRDNSRNGVSVGIKLDLAERLSNAFNAGLQSSDSTSTNARRSSKEQVQKGKAECTARPVHHLEKECDLASIIGVLSDGLKSAA